MSEEEKRPYVQKAEQDAIRYAREMEEHKKITGESGDEDESGSSSSMVEAREKILVVKKNPGFDYTMGGVCPWWSHFGGDFSGKRCWSDGPKLPKTKCTMHQSC